VVDTFTVGFSEKRLGESGFASQIARQFGAHHHHLVAEPIPSPS
jgi:asparagine synthetase B (glutamine-hydrolysing)